MIGLPALSKPEPFATHLVPVLAVCIGLGLGCPIFAFFGFSQCLFELWLHSARHTVLQETWGLT